MCICSLADRGDVAYYEPRACIRGSSSLVEARFYMTAKRVVLTTAGSREEARKIAHGLVEQRLAACVNIVGQVESVYRWQGKVEQAGEFLLIIKTTETALTQVRDAIRELHSYELPECVVLTITDGSKEYLEWLESSVD
jgi:periplasmic divalent cation tolerance protein